MTRRDAGFSLIEVLVALTIIAAMTAVMMTTLAAHARTGAAARHRRLAVLVAQSALDRAAAGDGADEGHWQDLVWRVTRSPYDDGDRFGTSRLERISVRVEGADHRRLVQISTVRIVR